jgi:hypothetical protein
LGSSEKSLEMKLQVKPNLILCLALVLSGAFAGCVTHRDDVRLQGTWSLNRSATAAVSSNVPARVVWVTYSHGAEVVVGDEAQYGYLDVSFHYHVVEQGSNFIVIRTTAPTDKGRDIRIRFVDADMGYWIDTGSMGYGIQERFDKHQPKSSKPLPPGMDGVIPPPVIPLDW